MKSYDKIINNIYQLHDKYVLTTNLAIHLTDNLNV